MEELGDLNICVGPVNTIEEALTHPQTNSRNMVVDVEHPSAGLIKQIGTPLKFSDLSVEVDRLPAPELGQHTKEFLVSMGLEKEKVSDLMNRNIIGKGTQ